MGWQEGKSEGMGQTGRSEVEIVQAMSKRLPCPTQGEATFPVHVVGMELDLYCFPYDPVHPSEVLGQNASTSQSTWRINPEEHHH
jgi:hypothetical protein